VPRQGGGAGARALEAESARPLRHSPQGPHRRFSGAAGWPLSLARDHRPGKCGTGGAGNRP
jgi:hypothetical protein